MSGHHAVDDPPRIKRSAHWREEPAADLFMQAQRQSKLGGLIVNLVALDEPVGFSAIAVQVGAACLGPDRSQCQRPPYSTEAVGPDEP